MERLRWVAIAGSALLLLTVAAFVGYGRYKALQTFRKLVAHSGAHITRETNGFTYSQTVKGRTIFTIHAARAQQHEDGKWTLHDAELTLFGKSGERTDHIYGAQFEYDPQGGVARALGEVHMDLQAPHAEGAASTPQVIRSKEGRAPSALRSAEEDTHTIHVVTSGLVYVRSLGVAATQQDVELRYLGITAHARGAEFDESDSIVHLLADVRLDGELRGRAVHLQASRADLDRGHEQVSLLTPMVESEGKRLTAHDGVLYMNRDGTVNHAVANGAVKLTEGTRSLRGEHLELAMGGNAQPRSAVLTGGARLVDTSANRPLEAEADRVDASFDSAGAARDLIATGHAHAHSGAQGLARNLAGDRIQVTLAGGPHHQQARLLEADGHASTEGDTLDVKTGVRRHTSLLADDLTAHFAEGTQRQLHDVVGKGHVHLSQASSTGEQQTSTADTIALDFGADGQVANATEQGHVQMHSSAPARKGHPAQALNATSDTAIYSSVRNHLRLAGNASAVGNGSTVRAQTIEIDTATNDSEATGDVLASFAAAPGRESSHITADHATFARAGQLAVFTATDRKPARLWQGASQLQAASIVLNGEAHTLQARPASSAGSVMTIFSAAASAGKPPRSTRLLSAALDYSDNRGEAVFTGGVRMLASGGDVRSSRAVVFLSPRPVASSPSLAAGDPAGRSLERAVLSGDIHLTQPGRSATGDQLLYTAANETFVLTGTAAHPPHAVDAQQGSVTGSTLVFQAADSTIVVAGEGHGHGRVRTDTGVAVPPAAEQGR